MVKVRKGENPCGCMPMESGMGCCKVESLIRVDERGRRAARVALAPGHS